MYGSSDMCYKYADYLIRKHNKYKKEKYQIELEKVSLTEDDNKYHPLSNKRLQKILFMATVLYGIKYHKRLFRDDFEAWSYGPVMPEIYDAYSIFQFDNMMPLFAKKEIDKNKKDILDMAFDIADKYTTDALIEKAHEVGSPWYFSFNKENSKKIDNYNIIPFDLIINYYSSKEKGQNKTRFEKLFECSLN